MTTVSRWLLVRLERLLALLVGGELAEAVLGDALEADSDLPGPQAGLPIRELLRSLPPLIVARIGRLFSPREVDRSMDTWPNSMRRAAAILGVLACLPALLLVTGGILQMFFGSPDMLRWLEQTLHNERLPVVNFLRQPATILGGLLLAGALNLLPLIRLALSRQDGSMVGTVSVRMRSAHLAVGAAAVLLTAVIVGYAFTENYVVAPRRPASQVTLPVLVSDGKSEWRSDLRVYVPQHVSCDAEWTVIPVRLAAGQDPFQSAAAGTLRFVRLLGPGEGCMWEPASP